jgi:hypothetical protein
MSIQQQQDIEDLKKRVAELEARVLGIHVWEATASGGMPITDKTGTLKLPEKRKSA